MLNREGYCNGGWGTVMRHCNGGYCSGDTQLLYGLGGGVEKDGRILLRMRPVL